MLWAQTRALPVSWLPKGARVLDVGCGPGKLKLARPDLDVFGFEPDEQDMQTAITRGVKEWPPVVPFDFAMAAPPLFDALFCMDVVEHMADPFGDLTRWLDLLRTGGPVIVEAPDFWGPVAQEWGDNFRLLHDPDHVSLFTTESLVRMLRDLGVQVEDVAFPFYGGPFDTLRRGSATRADCATRGGSRRRAQATSSR